MKYVCPVCGYRELPSPPVDMSYEICPSCGTEFGYNDFRRSHNDLMMDWVRGGMRWHASWQPQPPDWKPRQQLLQHVIPSARAESGTLQMFETTSSVAATEQKVQTSVSDTTSSSEAA
jgi:hypothetical protein